MVLATFDRHLHAFPSMLVLISESQSFDRIKEESTLWCTQFGSPSPDLAWVGGSN